MRKHFQHTVAGLKQMDRDGTYTMSITITHCAQYARLDPIFPIIMNVNLALKDFTLIKMAPPNAHSVLQGPTIKNKDQ